MEDRVGTVEFAGLMSFETNGLYLNLLNDQDRL
jgi:hypothetical protein